MKQLGLNIFLAAATLFVAGSSGHAQPYSPYGPYGPNAPSYYNSYARPTLSPYLNLIRGGSPAANYYMGVLPEIDRRANAALFGGSIMDLEQRTMLLGQYGETLDLTPGTGHVTTFGNTGGYFSTGPGPRQGILLNAGVAPARRGR